MMRLDANLSLTRWTMILALFVTALFSPCGVIGQGRGQGVKINVEGGETIDLYEGSYALVIGAVNYQYWKRLPGVKSDVEAVTTVLQKQGFRVEALLDPTSESFDRKMRKFISDYGQSPNNRLLIYFAGHGHTLITGDKRNLGYIVPIDAPKADSGRFKEYGISMKQFADVYATELESKHVLFIFDSCFSGSIFATRSAGEVPPAIVRNTAEPVRQFITAGSELELVPDRSIFRDYFVNGLEGEADLNRDGYITGSELGLYLENKVTNDPKSSQKPQWGKISSRELNKGDFVFQVSSNFPVIISNISRVTTLLGEATQSLMFANFEKVISLSQETLRLDSRNAIAHRLISQAIAEMRTDIESAKREARAALSLLNNPQTAAEFEAQSWSHYLLGERDQALAEINQALHFDPKNALVYYMRGNLNRSKKDDTVFADWAEAIRLNPNNVLAYVNRGSSYNLKQEFIKALSDLNEAIRLNPNYSRTYAFRASTYTEKHDYEKAIDDYAEVIRLSNGNVRGATFEGRGRAYLGKQEYDKAVLDFSEAIKLVPGFASAYEGRAKAYRKLGRNQLADADEKMYKATVAK